MDRRPDRTPPPCIAARRSRSASLARLALLLVATVLPSAWAQSPRLATLQLGFDGALVADAWNPLRMTLRDVGPVVLEVVIDQGSLREGPVPLVYRATVQGGSGLTVFDDELYVPTWRTLSWTVRSGTATVASGSVPRAESDRRALDLVVTDAPGPWRGRLGAGARVVDVRAERLVTRSAAYDGVRSLVVAGDGEAPSASSLVAAAAAGAVVILADAAATSPALAHLAPAAGAAWRRVGAGWVVLESALDPGPAVLEAARADHDATVSAFAAVGRPQPPRSQSTVTILFGAAAYALAVLVVLRFGGIPGIVAAGAIAASASLVAWAALRPASATIETTRDVVIGGSGIGQRWRLHDLVSLPAAEIGIAAAARPIATVPLTTGPDGTLVQLSRWRAEQLVERPRVADLFLGRGDGDLLVNDGPRALTQVHVQGGGAYGTIAPGGAGAPLLTDAPPPSSVARALLDVVPTGTAIAHDGITWFVALADEPRGLDALSGGID